MLFHETHQRILRGEYEHDARKQRFLPVVAVLMHIHRSVGRRIDLQNVLGLCLLLFQKFHQLTLLMAFGAHHIPTVIHMVKFVGHSYIRN